MAGKIFLPLNSCNEILKKKEVQLEKPHQFMIIK